MTKEEISGLQGLLLIISCVLLVVFLVMLMGCGVYELLKAIVL